MTYIRQQALRAYVMAYLFAAMQTDSPGKSAVQIDVKYKSDHGVRRIELALASLESDGFVEDIGSSDTSFSLTSEGYNYAERSYLDEVEPNNFKILVDRIIESEKRNGGETEIDTESGSGAQSVPASDRFVDVGHNSVGYVETLEAVENATEAIRQSNSLSPEDRPWIISNLTVGLDAFKRGGKLLVEGLKTFLIEPMKSALTTMSEEKLKAAVSIAIAAVRNFLGI